MRIKQYELEYRYEERTFTFLTILPEAHERCRSQLKMITGIVVGRVLVMLLPIMALTSNSPIKQYSSMAFSKRSVDRPHQMQLKFTNTTALVTRTLDLFERSQKPQIYIGIAGAPGSGKSTFAQRLVHWINRVKNDPTFAVLIPMGALAKVESSDLKNAQFVQRTSRNHANVIIANT